MNSFDSWNLTKLPKAGKGCQAFGDSQRQGLRGGAHGGVEGGVYKASYSY